MLKSLKRITYLVDDLEKAKGWYNSLLEMQPVFASPFAAIYQIGDCSLSLSKPMSPLTETGERMAAYWEVDDIDAVFQKFIDHGARIQLPVKQVFHIRIAQVIDPFGNTIGFTSESPGKEDRTVEKKPSETAHGVAFCRALASKESRRELKGPDHMAELFLSDDAIKILRDEGSMRWAVENLVTSRLYGYMIARTAFIDSVFKSACEADIPQIVFLGAGYDTRSYRFSDILKSTRLFEVDISTTQQRKIEILRNHRVAIPDSLSFVPVNFRKDCIRDALEKAGYDSRRKTLFIWEGVTYYLTREEVESTLDFIRISSAAGSILCLDYLSQKLNSTNPSEPFRFWGSKEEIEAMMSDHGIKIDRHLDAAEMTENYLTLRDGTIAESVLTTFCIIKARI